jgi:predicted HD phosphohydrolase
VAPAQREVVDPHHTHGAGWLFRQRADQAQQGVLRDRNTEPASEPGSRPGRERHGDLSKDLLQQRSPPRVRPGQMLHLLNERHHRAGACYALEPAHHEFNHHHATAQGGVGQPASVAAMHPHRRRTATWTSPAASAGPPPHPH